MSDGPSAEERALTEQETWTKLAHDMGFIGVNEKFAAAICMAATAAPFVKAAHAAGRAEGMEEAARIAAESVEGMHTYKAQESRAIYGYVMGIVEGLRARAAEVKGGEAE